MTHPSAELLHLDFGVPTPTAREWRRKHLRWMAAPLVFVAVCMWLAGPCWALAMLLIVPLAVPVFLVLGATWIQRLSIDRARRAVTVQALRRGRSSSRTLALSDVVDIAYDAGSFQGNRPASIRLVISNGEDIVLNALGAARHDELLRWLSQMVDPDRSCWAWR